MFPSILLIFSLSYAAADPYTCTSQNINLTATNPTFSINATQMKGGQNCQLRFTFPPDYMAEIRIDSTSLTTGMDTIVLSAEWGPTGILDSQNIQDLSCGGGPSGVSNCSIHVMWPPNYVNLAITTDRSTTMILEVDIELKLLSLTEKETKPLSTKVNQQPYFIPFTDWKEDTAITAHAAGGYSPVLDNTMVANIFVYNGTADNPQFYGTLLSITSEVTGTLVTLLDTVTLYLALNSGAPATMVINDYDNIKDISSVSITWSPSQADQNYQASSVLDATHGASALTVINDGTTPIYLEKVEYTNCPCPENPSPVFLSVGGLIQNYNITLVAMYRDWKMYDDNNYPQFLPGVAWTFILQKGVATIFYTTAAYNTKETEAANGRNGFIMSDNYPFLSDDQNSEEFVMKSVNGEVFTFEYTIREQTLDTTAYLNYSLKDQYGTNSFVRDLYNLTAPATFNLTALEMTMTIYGSNSTGTFIPYRIFSTSNFSDDTVGPTKGTTELPASQGMSAHIDTTTIAPSKPSTAGYHTTTATTLTTTQPLGMTSTALHTTSTGSTTTHAPSVTPYDVVFICLGFFLFLICVIIVAVIILRYNARRGKLRRFWVTVSGALPITVKIDKWELGDKQLEVLEDRELGQGAFALVFEGRLKGNWPVDQAMPSSIRIAEKKSQVAVKRLPPKSDVQAKLDFLAEINFMKKLGTHPHILGMIGCITASGPPMMVLEFCENGDLLSWVRKHKYSAEQLPPQQLLSIAWQISDGLCYLKSINLLHRDLAARNVLLTKELVAKISDFGLSREPEIVEDSTTYMPRYYVSRGGRLPIKWLAPEALRDCHFSFKTDIWSYGILLWEMFTFGDVPFAAIQAPAFLEILESGERLPKGGIPDPIYEIMRSCWEAEPKMRITIEKIKDVLHEMLKGENEYRYLMVSPWEGMGDEEEDLHNSTV